MVRGIWVQIPAPSLNNFVALGFLTVWHESNKSCVTRLLWGSGKMMSIEHLVQCLLNGKCSVKRGLGLKYWLIIGFLMVGTYFNYYTTPIYFVAHRRQLCLLSQRDLSLSLFITHTHTHTPKNDEFYDFMLLELFGRALHFRALNHS